ncbi:YdeI/OmpD-associated family protein [Labrys neptuniae]
MPQAANSKDAGSLQFRTEVLTAGKTATGIQIPDDVIARLAAGRKPAVKITINGFTYRSTVAVMNGRFMVGINAENREKAGVSGGDIIDVGIALDTDIREVAVPADFQAILAGNPGIKARFDSLSYTKRRVIVEGITGAKTEQTRQKRIERAVHELEALVGGS